MHVKEHCTLTRFLGQCTLGNGHTRYEIISFDKQYQKIQQHENQFTKQCLKNMRTHFPMQADSITHFCDAIE